MSLKDISYLELWQPLCSLEANHSCNFDRRHHEEQFCEIILNLDQMFSRRFLIWSSGGHFIQQSRTNCAVFGKGQYEEQFCEIILNLDQWFKRRCLLWIFLIWSSVSPPVPWSGTICAILKKGIMGNIHVK